MPKIVIQLSLGRDWRQGEWCPDHNLPGRFFGTLYQLTDNSVGPFKWIEGCDCVKTRLSDLRF